MIDILKIIISFSLLLNSVEANGQGFILNERDLGAFDIKEGAPREISYKVWNVESASDSFHILSQLNHVTATFGRDKRPITITSIDTFFHRLTRFESFYGGNTLSKEYHYVNEKLTEKVVFKFDNEDRLLSEDYYDPQDNTLWNRKNEYDNNGNLIQQSTYYPNKKLTTRHTFLYDNHGRLIKSLVYDTQGNRLKNHSIIYNNASMIDHEIDSVVSVDGKLLGVRTKVLSFDNGMIVREEIITTASMVKGIYEYRYKFDNKGNWTSLVYYANKKANTYIERSITYKDN